MAIPKTLKKLDAAKAEMLIKKHMMNGTGQWEYPDEVGDFVYKEGTGYILIRRNFVGEYETGKVAM